MQIQYSHEISTTTTVTISHAHVLPLYQPMVHHLLMLIQTGLPLVRGPAHFTLKHAACVLLSHVSLHTSLVGGGHVAHITDVFHVWMATWCPRRVELGGVGGLGL